MGMGTVLLVVLVVGAAVFLRNRPQGSKASKPVESVSARPEEKRDLSAAPMEKKVHPQGGIADGCGWAALDGGAVPGIGADPSTEHAGPAA